MSDVSMEEGSITSSYSPAAENIRLNEAEPLSVSNPNITINNNEFNDCETDSVSSPNNTAEHCNSDDDENEIDNKSKQVLLMRCNTSYVI